MSSRTCLNKSLGDTEFLLDQWGRWRKEGMGVPRLACANSGPSNLPSACITDDVALAIDAAVSRLTCRDKQMGQFILIYYGDKRPALWIGREHGMGEAKARELIKAGVAWLDGFLERGTLLA